MLGLLAHRLFNTAQRPHSACALARERCAARAQAEPSAEEMAPGGSGWFESSHALLAGLTVVEHHSLHGDTLELAVALWLH
jgi:hypothetical protein